LSKPLRTKLNNRRNLMPYSKYSPKQKKLAAVRPPRDKITAADLKALKKKKNGNKKRT